MARNKREKVTGKELFATIVSVIAMPFFLLGFLLSAGFGIEMIKNALVNRGIIHTAPDCAVQLTTANNYATWITIAFVSLVVLLFVKTWKDDNETRRREDEDNIVRC
jgi:Na+/H+ antiporter NhaC